MEITASRLRVLGHPVRLRIMRALDERRATVPQLATELGAPEVAVAAHVRLLHRAGILARVDGVGPPAFQLCDWPSLWMVDQLARRLREQTLTESDPATDIADDEDPDEGFTCR
ncbi:helix-turn-helix domain-containing protein [Paraconexibacter antarcticus]|uniref:Helix-turn-helix domain-containing protein n=1 Tax=Paraconexibacter antarcticus TaxID=2949664 RepID=A0ABY5DSY2_9ACTN|nr:helix-turn-helix domain-containing protein [Paraconexibacter antarcticus]UTI63932.1 helix-turn-helix domain-containing protein [Paraconexibacter antarcticus]